MAHSKNRAVMSCKCSPWAGCVPGRRFCDALKPSTPHPWLAGLQGLQLEGCPVQLLLFHLKTPPSLPSSAKALHVCHVRGHIKFALAAIICPEHRQEK
eukprot:1139217-Pelagomonas_calceolata.AAC.5